MEETRRMRLMILAISGLVMASAIGGWMWYRDQKQLASEWSPPPPLPPAIHPSAMPLPVVKAPAAAAPNLVPRNKMVQPPAPPVLTVQPHGAPNAPPAFVAQPSEQVSPPAEPVTEEATQRAKQQAEHAAQVSAWKEARKADLYSFLFANGNSPPPEPPPELKTSTGQTGAKVYPATRWEDAAAQARAAIRKRDGSPFAAVSPSLYVALGARKFARTAGTDWSKVVGQPAGPNIPKAPNPVFPAPDLVPPPPPDSVQIPIEQIPPPPDRPFESAKMRLIGIVGDSAIFAMPGLRNHLTLCLGDEYSGVKLVAIGDSSVTIEEDGTTETKAL